MKILQFGFEDVRRQSLDSPHYCIPHSIVYTGTHDNDVTNGWYNGLTEQQQQYINDYTHRSEDESICPGHEFVSSLQRLAIRRLPQCKMF